jgi:hypothetical protein
LLTTQQAVAQITPEKMLLVCYDSHKPSGDSEDSPDGSSELDCEAVWVTACQEATEIFIFIPKLIHIQAIIP